MNLLTFFIRANSTRVCSLSCIVRTANAGVSNVIRSLAIIPKFHKPCYGFFANTEVFDRLIDFTPFPIAIDSIGTDEYHVANLYFHLLDIRDKVIAIAEERSGDYCPAFGCHCHMIG